MNSTRRHFSHLSLALGTVALAGAFGSLSAQAANDAAEAKALVQKAQATVSNFAKNKDIPDFGASLATARGVLIFPKILKAGFVLGGSGGTGVLMVRNEQTGNWSGPVFYTMGSASLGLQAGASSAEMVMLVHSQKALDSLYASKVKLGGDASVAVWKKGMGASAAISADFVAYALVKGAFAGLAVDGSVIDVRESLNTAYFGEPVRPVDILARNEMSRPGSADLQAALKNAAK